MNQWVLLSWIGLVAIPLQSIWADDVVTFVGAGGATAQFSGQIVDYTGRQLEIDVTGGIRRKVPAEQIVEVQTKYDPDQIAADALYNKHDYAAALPRYRKAMERDTRRWVRRRLLGQIVRSYRELSQFAQAGEHFLLLVKDDPDALDFDAIPLAWIPGETGAETLPKGVDWLGRDDQPVAVLLGASHLLQSSHQAGAMQKLQKLLDQRDPRIALLAAAQILRASTVTINESELKRWSETITRCPELLRAGPYYTLGRTWLQRGDSELAATHLLRIPILYPRQHTLAAESSLLAAEALHKSAQPDAVHRLLRELISTYPQSRAATEAATRASEWGVQLKD